MFITQNGLNKKLLLANHRFMFIDIQVMNRLFKIASFHN